MSKPKADNQLEFVRASERPSAVNVESYPYQVVAEIAARLLVGNDYTDAAKRAISLIRACRSELAERERLTREQRRASDQARDMDALTLKRDGKPFVMTWRELLEYITGESDEGRGQRNFKKYLAYVLRHHAAKRSGVSSIQPETPSEKEILAKLAYMKRTGLCSSKALGHKLYYLKWQKLDAKNRATNAALARHGKKSDSK